MRRGFFLPFRYVGSPLRLNGSGSDVSVSFVLTRTFGGELMKIHCISGYMSVLYLVEYPENEKFLLLDSGFPGDLERIRFYIEDVMALEKGTRQLMSEKLQLVVATHSHIDHIGAALGYARCGIPVAVAEDMGEIGNDMGGRVAQLTEAFLAQFVAYRLGRKVFENPFIYSQSLLGPYWKAPEGALLLGDVMPLPLGFDDWVAIKCPGHTSHMLCLYHPYCQIFYLADMLVGLKKGFFPPFLIGNECAYNYSIHRLRSLPTRCALLAHGGIVDVNVRCGSWNSLIDEVVHNWKLPNTNSFIFKITKRFKTLQNTFSVRNKPSVEISFGELSSVRHELGKLPELHFVDS